MAQAIKHFYLQTSDLRELLGIEDIAFQKLIKKFSIKLISSQGKVYIKPQDVRTLLNDRGYQYQLQVVSFQMLKGGVAKTTSALNFGLRAHMYGARVLFIDLDQQANLSFALGVDDLKAPTFLQVIEGQKSLTDCLIHLDSGLDLLPANLNNSVIERVLMQGVRNVGQVVRAPLKTVQDDYDLIIIDTAPALSALNTAVSCASDLVVLPVSPDKFTLFGLQKHLADLKHIKQEFSVDFATKILFTRFDSREASSSVYLDECLERYSDLMLKSYIRNSTDIKTLVATKKTLFDSKGNGKADYDLVTRELLGLWT